MHNDSAPAVSWAAESKESQPVARLGFFGEN